MSKFNVSDLKPGMKFDAPVYIEGNNILVPPNVGIKEKDIERLKRWDIKNVETEGKIITKDQNIIPEKTEQTGVKLFLPGDEKFLNVYSQSFKKLQTIYYQIKEGNTVEHDAIDRIVSELYTNVKSNKNEMIQMILQEKSLEDDITEKSVNCMIIAVVIGMNLKIISHRLLQLATAALLHNVGMLRIPEKIIKKKDNLSVKEIQAIQTHPVISYRIISKELKYPEETARAALYYHEKWDGTGYPKKLSGKDIPLFSRIIAVADTYAAMVKERPYRTQMIGYDAIKTIIRDNFKSFDPDIIKAFLKGMGIYPIGSIVLLNNSIIGRVVETQSTAPLRPKIEVLINEKSKKQKEPQIIDLLTEDDLFIVRAVDPKKVKEMNYV